MQLQKNICNAFKFKNIKTKENEKLQKWIKNCDKRILHTYSIKLFFQIAKIKTSE